MVREVGLEVIASGLYDGSLEPWEARSKTDLAAVATRGARGPAVVSVEWGR
jgi:hypothetical protein